MAAAEWWCWPLPAWLCSGAAWFVLLNVVVGAIAALSSRAQQPPSPSPSASPRRGGGGGGSGITRRASSVMLQRIRSFSIFSFPSSCFHHGTEAPDATPTTFQETEEPGTGTGTVRRWPSPSTPRSPPAGAAEPSPATEEEEEEDVSAMSMDEAYALVLAGRQRPPPTEEEVSRYEVDAKAEEFIRGFKEDLRQQRLNSIFNYTQMLKRRAAGRRTAGGGGHAGHQPLI